MADGAALLTYRKSSSAPAAQPSPKPRTVRHVALIGNFPPRRCGIATFTSDVHEALISARPDLRCDIIAMNDCEAGYAYSDAVTACIRQTVLGDYDDAAQRINAANPDVVLLQHEYGIFGGAAGEYVLRLIERIDAPVVTTLHTVLTHPTADQRRVMSRLIDRSSRIVVMAERGKMILTELGAPADKIVVTPHGAPDLGFLDAEDFKPGLDLEGRDVILTFGLLSPNKGLESMIRALPSIAAAHPDVLYVILGATHPHLVAREGEGYRDSLGALAEELGVSAHVRFVNRYVDKPLLLDYLAAADLYVTPYLNEAQITSGTLSYAVALGKPVISTPYWHAQELLGDGRGVLAPFNDSDALAREAITLLGDSDKRHALRERAYEAGRATIWPRIGEQYMNILDGVRPRNLVPLRREGRTFSTRPPLDSVRRLTDSCGIVQHGVFAIPDRDHGYCLDDNARALILTCTIKPVTKESAALGFTYAAFIQHAFNPESGSFRNFMSFDRRWLEHEGSSDSIGRAMWALGVAADAGPHEEIRTWAADLFRRAMPKAAQLIPLRSRAFTILGLDRYLEACPDDGNALQMLRDFGTDLHARLMSAANAEWRWFEDGLAYDNARLPEALIRAATRLGEPGWRRDAIQALGWLCQVQSGPSGCFRPVGSETFGDARSTPKPFDQQPLEAYATICACETAYEAAPDPRWLKEAHRAYAWFFGENDLGVALVSLEDGGCHDGLTPCGGNRNQGAESVLSFQLAARVMATLFQEAENSAANAP